MMKKYYKKCLLSCILAVSLLCGCAGGTDAGESEEGAARQDTESVSEQEERDSSAVPDFEGNDMEGNAVTSEIFSGSRLTMVNVWATYCSPCLNEMPELGELAREYDKEDFQLIGIVSNVPEGADEEKLELVEVLIEQTEADYPHLLLNESLNDGLLSGVSAVPTTFFIGQDGKILDTVVGARDKAAWKEIIDGILEESPES